MERVSLQSTNCILAFHIMKIYLATVQESIEIMWSLTLTQGTILMNHWSKFKVTQGGCTSSHVRIKHATCNELATNALLNVGEEVGGETDMCLGLTRAVKYFMTDTSEEVNRSESICSTQSMAYCHRVNTASCIYMILLRERRAVFYRVKHLLWTDYRQVLGVYTDRLYTETQLWGLRIVKHIIQIDLHFPIR